MRITATYLKNWLQQEFDRLEIDLEVREGYATRYRSHDYENGAAFYNFRVAERGSTHFATVYCKFHRTDIEHCLKIGYKLKWQPKRCGNMLMVSDSEIDLQKI